MLTLRACRCNSSWQYARPSCPGTMIAGAVAEQIVPLYSRRSASVSLFVIKTQITA